MTKKALIIIGIIILIPILVTIFFYLDYCRDNPVVAQYDGDVTRIVYKGTTLIAVDSEENYYTFRYGEYLGKIGDRDFGASLYRVRDDKSGEYYAVADREKNLLYTESGVLADGVKGENSKVSRIVFDNYATVIDGADAEKVHSALCGESASEFEFKPSRYLDENEKKLYKMYDLSVAYDGSAIVTDKIGKLYYLQTLKKWVFVPLDVYEEGVDEYGESSSKLVFASYMVDDAAADLIIKSYIEKE
jgi:hypothetical protein